MCARLIFTTKTAAQELQTKVNVWGVGSRRESPGIRAGNFDPARPHLSILVTTGDSVHTG